MKKSKYIKYVLFAFVLTVLLSASVKNVNAKALDEILDYTVTVDVNADATLNMQYDISWKVLDSSSEGPLSWVSIGLSNRNYSDIIGLSDNIQSIEMKSSGGTYAEIYFDRDYYEDEVVDFSFVVTMDNMYTAYPDDGYVEYVFTPGWFDDINIDNLTIKWNNENATGWSPDCLVDGGYNVWNTRVAAGSKYTVSMKYDADAYGFDMSKKQNDESGGSGVIDAIGGIIALIICICVFCAGLIPFAVPAILFYLLFKKGRGFSQAAGKKVTRTIIEYYPACPNCGGNREEGKDTCAYCGSSMIKSKNEVKEEDIPKEDRGVLSYETDGDYRFSANPNRYVRVHVVPMPVHTHSSGIRVSTAGRSSGGSRSHHSSCAHSSCACACACACAGGGRAGCTTKDFYNTALKLSHLKPR